MLVSMVAKPVPSVRTVAESVNVINSHQAGNKKGDKKNSNRKNPNGSGGKKAGGGAKKGGKR